MRATDTCQWVMLATRMETRLEHLEAEIKRIPTLEESVNETKAHLGGLTGALSMLTQKIDELLQRLQTFKGSVAINPEASGFATPLSRIMMEPRPPPGFHSSPSTTIPLMDPDPGVIPPHRTITSEPDV